MTSFNFEVECEECGERLKAYFDKNNDTLIVELCDDCSNAFYKEGYEAGKAEEED